MSIVELIKSWNDRYLEYAGDIKFNKRDSVDVTLVALYGSIINFTSAIIILLERDGRIAIPSVFRSLLEASVELRNLAANHDYINHMRAGHAEQWLKVFKEADTENPYLKGIADLKELNDATAQFETTLRDMKKAGFRPLNVFERFEKAGMVEEYRSLYNFLSCDAHSNLRALLSRQLQGGEDDFQVVYYKDEPIETFLPTLDSTAALLHQATVTIHQCLESPHIKVVKATISELEGVRTEYFS